MERIVVRKRGEYLYIAFKDSCPFEWATGTSTQDAVRSLKKAYPCLNKETTFNYKRETLNYDCT